MNREDVIRIVEEARECGDAFERRSIDLTDGSELVISHEPDEGAVYIDQVKMTNWSILGTVVVPLTHVRELARVLSEAADYLEGKA